MDHQPLVSVVCPVYNAEEYLGQTIRSVLEQTYSRWELLLVIDQKSSDRSLELARTYQKMDDRIHVLENTSNLGVANNRNNGIRKASGDFVAFLDADDLWLPQKLERQVRFMLKNNYEFSCHSYEQIDPKGNPTAIIRHCPTQISYSDLLKFNRIGCLTVMIKAPLIKQFLFLDKLPHEDFLLWLEILKKIPAAHGLDESLALYRVLPNSRSSDKKRAARDRWFLYRNILKLNLISSIYYFAHYAFHSLKVRMPINLSN